MIAFWSHGLNKKKISPICLDSNKDKTVQKKLIPVNFSLFKLFFRRPQGRN